MDRFCLFVDWSCGHKFFLYLLLVTLVVEKKGNLKINWFWKVSNWRPIFFIPYSQYSCLTLQFYFVLSENWDFRDPKIWVKQQQIPLLLTLAHILLFMWNLQFSYWFGNFTGEVFHIWKPLIQSWYFFLLKKFQTMLVLSSGTHT